VKVVSASLQPPPRVPYPDAIRAFTLPHRNHIQIPIRREQPMASTLLRPGTGSPRRSRLRSSSLTTT
jgi:hypothetical protein